MELDLKDLPKLFAAHDARLWHYRAYVLRVIDGDTLLLLVDRGFHSYNLEKVRLAGVDAPEARPRIGTTAQRTAEKALAAKATARLTELVGNKEVVIQTQKTGKFGRWLATVFIEPDRSVNDILLEEKLAVEYGSPRPWRNES